MNAVINMDAAHFVRPVTDNPVKRSDVLLAAWIAAEERLPAESLALIKAHDKLHAAWREAGWQSPVPAELEAASKAVAADPLASIAFDLRQKTNQAGAEEYRAEETARLKNLSCNTPRGESVAAVVSAVDLGQTETIGPGPNPSAVVAVKPGRALAVVGQREEAA